MQGHAYVNGEDYVDDGAVPRILPHGLAALAVAHLRSHIGILHMYAQAVEVAHVEEI